MTSARVITAVLALIATGALADQDRGGIVSEVKIGVLQHDVEFLPVSREPGQVLNGEVLFDSPGLLDPIWSPRPHLGASVSLEGETDQLYAGLTWTFRPFDDGRLAPLWVSAFGGGAIHDGEEQTTDPDRKALGSPVLFRFGGEVGWDVSNRVNLSVHYSHVSNAYLADVNEGMDQAGIRLGWRF